jgi:plastocyanin
MHRLLIFVGLVATLGIVGAGGYAVAQDTPASPEVVEPATPEILPELCATVEGIATPVEMSPATPEGAAATPALFPCATPEGSSTTAGGTANAVTIEAIDIAWNPKEVTISADTDVTVTVPNTGASLHTFVIEALGIKIEIAPGETKEVVINAPAGTYEFICDVPGHAPAGMVGTLTVQ